MGRLAASLPVPNIESFSRHQWFSSLVSNTAPSSQETAVFTRVSSVAESLSQARSSSYLNISPGVGIASPFRRLLFSML